MKLWMILPLICVGCTTTFSTNRGIPVTFECTIFGQFEGSPVFAVLTLPNTTKEVAERDAETVRKRLVSSKLISEETSTRCQESSNATK